jgi:cytochrome c553
MLRFVAFVLCALTLGAAHAQGDPIAGKTKAQPCQACHGEEGRSASPQFPVLAGQYPDYLVQALMAYKSGARDNAIMAPFAQSLSREDMEDLAAYFSTRPNGVYLKPIGR